MAIKSKSVTVSFFVQDAAAGGGKTGDAANLSARIISDGTGSAPTNSIAEIDATNAKGWYKLVVTAGENAGAMMSLAVQSTTADIYSAGASWTNEHNISAVDDDETAADNLELACDNYSVTRGLSGTALPAAAADAAGGLVISDAGGFNIDAVTVTTNAAIADAVWTEAIADHSGTAGSTAESLDGATAPTAAAVADAVWDEAIGGHVSASTFGLVLQNINTATATTEADVVSILTDTGTTLPAQIWALNDPTAAAIADAVWDELQSGHTTAGTFGKYLDTEVSGVSGGSLTEAGIADAVWDELQSGHVTAGSFGEIATEIAAILVDTGTTLPATLTTIDGVVDDILVDTAEIGAAGAGLTAIPWNASWDAEVQSEVNDGLVALGLDHLVSAAVTGTDITDNSIIAKLVDDAATADWDGYDNTNSSLEALRARGDAAWTTGSGGSPPQLLQNTTIATLATQISFTLTDGSADDDAYNGAVAIVTDSATATQKAVAEVSDYVGLTETVTLATDPGIFTMSAGDTIDILAAISNAPTAAAVADAVLDEALSGHITAGTLGKAVADIEADATVILADTNELQADWVNGGRLDLILHSRASQSSVDTVDTNVDAILVDTGTTLDGKINTIDTVVDAIKVVTDQFVFTVANQVDANALTGGGGDPASIADAVLDEATVGHVAAGSFGKLVADIDSSVTTVDGIVDAILVDTGTTLPATLTSLSSDVATVGANVLTVDTVVDGISVDTGTTIPALVGGLNDPTAAAIADAVWDEAQAGHVTAGTFGLYLDAAVSSAGGGGGDATEAKQDTIIASLTAAKGAGFIESTDSLEAIRDRGDSAWITAGGVGSPWDAVLNDYSTAGTFGARFQEAERYTNTDVEIKYVNRGDAYDDVANAKLQWATTTDFTSGWTGLLIVTHRVTGATLLSHAIEIADATTLKANLGSDDTDFALLTTDAEFGAHPYQVVMTHTSTSEQTVIPGGSMVIRK